MGSQTDEPAEQHPEDPEALGIVPAQAPRAAAGGRRLALDVHGHLRAMILSGELTPGSPLLQAEMARRLGVSRTPMREAFRLLQEEGLIDARPDQRARVRAVDPADLDAVYGARIMLESLAAGVTARTLGEPDLGRMSGALERMRRHVGDDRPEEWFAAHREFHGVAAQAVGPQLQRMIASLTEHGERHVRLARLGGPGVRGRADEDHQALLSALRARNEAEATRVVARHLARTALSVLAFVAPEHEPTAVRAAFRMVCGEQG
ncbi:GntR family transcriptional regulator [Streptomyces sp. NPDC089424]|uniref:GntR family transcriptional regulator n=1 Tax=Streptomyces sp. NPDC089424 TaxID=3365917 RepID=UPI00382C0043